MNKRRTTESLVEEIKEIFGDKYAYDEVVYQGMNKPVVLTCVEHKYTFEQSPVHILRKQQKCKYCSGKGLNTEDFVVMSKSVFGGNKFDYSKTLYRKMSEKVVFVCAVHGSEWSQLPQNHLKGNNPCQDCNGQRPINREEFIKRSKELFGTNRFDYSKVKEIKGIHTKITLICNKHNEEFIQEAWSNLNSKIGCPECNITAKMSPGKIKQKALLVHSGLMFDYSRVEWNKGIREKQTIGCHVGEHGFFKQSFDGHLMGKNPCQICYKENRLTKTDEFIERVKNVHGEDRYGFDKVFLKNGLQGDATLRCNKHNEYFDYDMFRILQGLEGCVKCRNSNVSKKEKELADFVENDLGFSIERSYRKIEHLSPKEVDIFIPEKNVAIEFNGLYWHSEANGKDKNYHYEKWLNCENSGVRLLTVWEDEWENKKDIVKSHLKHVLGVNDSEKVYARKTVFREISKDVAQVFLSNYHIQGFVGASIYVGLFKHDTDELVAVANFLKSDNDYVLSRYATSGSVVGGFSKIIKYFEKFYEYDKLVTFADRSFSDGGLYENNGWVADKELPPDYSYIMPNKIARFHKFGFRKKKFQQDSSLIFDDNMKEKQLAELNGLDRVWDLGKIRFIKAHPCDSK